MAIAALRPRFLGTRNIGGNVSGQNQFQNLARSGQGEDETHWMAPEVCPGPGREAGRGLQVRRG